PHHIGIRIGNGKVPVTIEFRLVTDIIHPYYGIKTVVKIVFVIQIHHQTVGIVYRRKVGYDFPFYFVICNTGLYAPVPVGKPGGYTGTVLFAYTLVRRIGKTKIGRISVYIGLILIVIPKYVYGKPLCSPVTYFYIGIEAGK